MKSSQESCRTGRCAWRAGLVGLLAVATAQLQAAPRQIVVREHLNQASRAELVSFPFEAQDGECVADSVQVTGPRGPLAAQLSAIEYWPGQERKFVKSARLSFVVDDLKPLSSGAYTVTCGKQAAAPVATDLRLQKSSGSVEITTARSGVRLAIGGQKYAPAVPLENVPSPMAGLRLDGGAWAGGSSLTGRDLVAQWSAELTDTGPVFARWLATYTFADGNVATIAASVAAGDNTVRWELTSRADRPALGCEFRLPPVPGVKQAVLLKGYGQWSRADRTLDLKPGAEPFTGLGPDTSIANAFPDCAWAVRLAAPDGSGLYLCTRDPSSWSEPTPLTYAGFKTWDLDMIPKMWEAWKRKRLLVSYAADGTVKLQANFAAGGRKWWTASRTPALGDQLDRVKDLVLDWPADPQRPHPRLFVSLPQLQDTWARAAGDPELTKVLAAGGPWAAAAIPVLMKPAGQRKPEEVTAVVKTLREQLALLGDFDVMRGAIGTATLYDVLINSDLLAPQDRSLFRAQMAYLGYLLADPRCWSMERGYASGNPNMSCSYTLSLGVIACVLSDHPAAKAWAERATQWLDKWLTDEVGPNGEWLPEGSHYGYVSLEPILVYAIAAKRAGYHDFSTDPRLKKLLLYFAKYNTPRDVQRKDLRSIGAYGRGHGGCLAVFGIAAPFFKDSDPALSRVLQWLWAENGYPYFMGDGRLGGCEPYYADRRLPAEAPAWTSERFPNLGALLRAGFNTPHESYVNVLTGTQSLRNLDIWTPGVGGISQWFGRGRPLSTCFTFAIGYNERHELLRDGVRLARNWGAPGDPKTPFGHYTETKFEAFAALPTADYTRSQFVNTKVDDRDWFPDNLPAFPRVKSAQGTTLTWTRQLLFVKDMQPAGPAWLLLRDTTGGGQPTAWQFWTLSENIVADRLFLADNKLVRVIVPARELPQSDRYTALGQFGVDVDYFIASPSATPRHTLRYGGMWAGNQIPEYQDLLHLQLPGDGAYYVALFPRPRQESSPAMTALADGRLIKVSGAFGTDYAFLATQPGEAAAEGVHVQGTAATIQERAAGAVLSLGAAGEVRFKEYGVSGASAISLRADREGLLITVTPSAQAQEFTVTAPGKWSAVGATIKESKDASLILTIPAGTTAARLTRK